MIVTLACSAAYRIQELLNVLWNLLEVENKVNMRNAGSARDLGVLSGSMLSQIVFDSNRSWRGICCKEWEYMNLGQLWELSEEQILVWCQRQGTFIWKRSRLGCGGGWQVRRKEAREGNMCFNMKASFLKWIWKSGRGWLQVLSLEGKRTGQWLLCIFYWFQLQNRWMEWSPMAQTLGRTGV